MQNKCDKFTQRVLQRILDEGCIDINPRPHYIDGTPAHTLSVNHEMVSYDLSKGEFPFGTLRPATVKSAIGELLWIYQDQSNDLNLLKDKYKVTWWDAWDIGNRTIGQCYGATVKTHDLMNKLLNEIKENPDGRRHIINLWQEDDFKQPHGLKPCAFQTVWNVRHNKDGIDYLDMCLFQRSSDFCTAGVTNQVQYATFLMLVAQSLDLKAGVFTWMLDNVQIYDRHIDNAKEMIRRKPVDCEFGITLNPNIKNFYDFTMNDIHINYPRKTVASINPQLKFELGI